MTWWLDKVSLYSGTLFFTLRSYAPRYESRGLPLRDLHDRSITVLSANPVISLSNYAIPLPRVNSLLYHDTIMHQVNVRWWHMEKLTEQIIFSRINEGVDIKNIKLSSRLKVEKLVDSRQLGVNNRNCVTIGLVGV